MSVGRRPTFYADAGLCLLEAYVLDFAGDLYGRQITVALCNFIRPEAKFPGLDALKTT